MWQLTLVALARDSPGGLPDAGGGGGAGPRQDDRVSGAGHQVSQVTHLVLEHLRSVPLLRGSQPAGAARTPGRLLAPPGHPRRRQHVVVKPTVVKVPAARPQQGGPAQLSYDLERDNSKLSYVSF